MLYIYMCMCVYVYIRFNFNAQIIYYVLTYCWSTSLEWHLITWRYVTLWHIRTTLSKGSMSQLSFPLMSFNTIENIKNFTYTHFVCVTKRDLQNFNSCTIGDYGDWVDCQRLWRDIFGAPWHHRWNVRQSNWQVVSH